MITFIALLRGINITGHKIIKMADLKSLFEDLRFTNVQTYIQSGNVIFDSKNSDTKSIKTKLVKKIKAEYGFDVEVIIKTNTDLKNVLDNNPFIKKKKDTERLYVTFLSEKPSPANAVKLNEINYSPEEFILDDNNIYLYFPSGYGKAKLNNNFFENKLKVSASTRNLNTISKLYELSKKG
ncbi:MAG: DUF1697 domain-containing protein [Ignavibacteriales bacterium]